MSHVKNFTASHKIFSHALTNMEEPKYFQEAVKDLLWLKAMAKEICALEENKTWIVQGLPLGKKSISCKWVYRVKYNSYGSTQRCKARLVICGDNQIKGFNYNETCALIAKMTSVRCFFGPCSHKGWELH